MFSGFKLLGFLDPTFSRSTLSFKYGPGTFVGPLAYRSTSTTPVRPATYTWFLKMPSEAPNNDNMPPEAAKRILGNSGKKTLKLKCFRAKVMMFGDAYKKCLKCLFELRT